MFFFLLVTDVQPDVSCIPTLICFWWLFTYFLYSVFVFEDSMLLEHSFLLVAVSDCIGLVYLRMCTCVNTCVCVCSVALRHLDNEPFGINHPDLFQTLFLSEPLLLHGHGDQLSNPHRCLGERRKEPYLLVWSLHEGSESRMWIY